jgi:hypothetical protein
VRLVVKQDAREIVDARQTSAGHMVRVAFYAPPDLVEDFRALASANVRTLSQEMRKLMAEEVARRQQEREQAE